MDSLEVVCNDLPLLQPAQQINVATVDISTHNQRKMIISYSRSLRLPNGLRLSGRVFQRPAAAAC
jgi:hypothetical protein